MHASVRQAAILKSLDHDGICTVTDLAELLAVSDETIRRDIKLMANKGLVERVYGGVMLPNLFQEPNFQKRLSHNAEAKEAIARTAAQTILNGESLMFDTGSTTAYVARALAEHQELLVVTNCTDIATALSKGKGNRVYLAGGEFRHDDRAVFGASTIRFVQEFRVRTAILSIGAISLEAGFMDFHLAEAEYSRAVLGCANKVIVVADHTKFGAQATVRVCSLEAVDVLVTDRAPPPAFAKALADVGVELLVAPLKRRRAG